MNATGFASPLQLVSNDSPALRSDHTQPGLGLGFQNALAQAQLALFQRRQPFRARLQKIRSTRMASHGLVSSSSKSRAA